MGRWLLYGAYGYTGRLTIDRAVAAGESPILAGRDAARLAEVAGPTGLEQRAFGLDDADQLRRSLQDVDAVVHMAGPFSATSKPMVDACLATHTHYLDITGEIDVFAAVLARDAEARAAGVVLLPGAGFDVVPTDCLAAQLAAKLPTATSLTLGINSRGGGSSAGTAKTAVESLHRGTAVRRGGVVRWERGAPPQRMIPFPSGERRAVSIPWGDVETAFHTTGIGEITVYMVLPERVARWMGRLTLAAPVLGLRPVQRVLQKIVEYRVEGPTPEQLATGWSEVWGEVADGKGAVVTGALRTPPGYPLTASSAVEAVRRVMRGDVEPGAYTPAKALGAGFVNELPGVTVPA